MEMLCILVGVTKPLARQVQGPGTIETSDEGSSQDQQARRS